MCRQSLSDFVWILNCDLTNLERALYHCAIIPSQYRYKIYTIARLCGSCRIFNLIQVYRSCRIDNLLSTGNSNSWFDYNNTGFSLFAFLIVVCDSLKTSRLIDEFFYFSNLTVQSTGTLFDVVIGEKKKFTDNVVCFGRGSRRG